MGSSQHPFAVIHPVPRNGEAITTGARRSTRTAGIAIVVVPIIGRDGALAGMRYLIRLVSNADLPAPDPNRPEIFTAIRQQLGLELKADKGPVDVIVIDHIDRPSPN